MASIYSQTFNIRHTKSQNLDVSRSSCTCLPNPLTAGVKSNMMIWLEQRQQAMRQLIWVINNFIAY